MSNPDAEHWKLRYDRQCAELKESRERCAEQTRELAKAHVISGAILRWLEENQPDVFRRGLHDCVAAAVTTMHGVKP
jgi:sugar (pentulose or hexulose) kinase